MRTIALRNSPPEVQRSRVARNLPRVSPLWDYCGINQDAHRLTSRLGPRSLSSRSATICIHMVTHMPNIPDGRETSPFPPGRATVIRRLSLYTLVHADCLLTVGVKRPSMWCGVCGPTSSATVCRSRRPSPSSDSVNVHTAAPPLRCAPPLRAARRLHECSMQA
jgi:hypothetical protein